LYEIVTSSATNRRRMPYVRLAAHNGGGGDDVIGIGRLAHAKTPGGDCRKESAPFFVHTAAAAREVTRRRSRNSKYAFIPSPVFADTLNTSMPGRTA
jgi:hypothetical protein